MKTLPLPTTGATLISPPVPIRQFSTASSSVMEMYCPLVVATYA